MNATAYTYHSLVVKPDSLDLDQAAVADSLAFLFLKYNISFIFLTLDVHT